MNGALDILTPRGRIAAQDQLEAAEIVFRHSTNIWFVHTPTDDAAAVDGFVIKDGFAVAIAEIKSRDNTLEEMMGEFNGEWLLTYQKLLGIQTISRLMLIPAFGFVYLKPSACVLAIRLTDANGLIVCSHHEKRTKTQATCN
jgi:hypothetical protein